MTLNRRHVLAAAAWPWAWPVQAQVSAEWPRTLQAARGQTVYFNAWAGSERINAYLQWAGLEVQRLHGIKLEHVKVADTAEVVKRVRAEKAAARAEGSADVVWINGENFLAMKREGLLFGPFAESLPAYAAVDTLGKPTTRVDFSEPVDGMEAPWGMAQLTFYADGARVAQPPRSLAALLDWAKANPGRFTYPRLPQFHGTTFVKQALLEANTVHAAFYQPFDATSFERLTPVLWAYLDTLHPHLWRAGKQFPANPTVMRQMLADGELHIALTFNPNEAANQIAAKTLPASVVSFQSERGSIGNTHFLAIPFNARAQAAAQVFINFMLTPAAQARKADIRHWGDPTVLDLQRLSTADRAAFAASQAPGQLLRSAPAWAEPHASWVQPLEREWLRRYGA